MLHAKFYQVCRRRFLKVFTIHGHGGHLGHVTWTIYIKFLSVFPRKVPQAVSEKTIFENNGQIHVYSPGAGTDSPPEVIFFHKHNYSVNLVFCCKFSPLNNFVTVFPIQTYRRPNLTLP